MRIYLVRHAEALPRGILPVDDHRHLVAEGRKQSRKLGKVLRTLGVEWDRILSSPSMRAVQTAEIVAARLKYRGTIETAGVLLGGEGDWAAYMAAAEHSGGKEVALVGHEPDLGVALGQALGRAPIDLPKGAVAGLERGSDGVWVPLGLLRPASSGWEPFGQAPASGKAARSGKAPRNGKAEKAGKAAGPANAAKDGERATGRRRTQPAGSAEFVNAEETGTAAEAPAARANAITNAAAKGKPREKAKAVAAAFTNEEAAARPAGRRNGRPKG